MRRYHMKTVQERYLDLNDYKPLLDVVLEKPSPWRRFLRWLISLLTKTGKAV